MRENIVLLHGFGGTHRMWDGVSALLGTERYLSLAPDLPGHGAAGSLRPITFDACTSHVLELAPERFTLCGYSMGGRIALHVALAQPARIRRLVLVSTTAGISNAADRAQRRVADERLALQLEREPFESFIERWRSQPIFAQEPPAIGVLARADQRRNRPEDLATVLRGIGSGEMAPLWERLHELTMPVTVLVGDRDAKFCELGRQLTEHLPDAVLSIVAGGHGLPLENPAAIAKVLGDS